jgi:hypothetical protein
MPRPPITFRDEAGRLRGRCQCRTPAPGPPASPARPQRFPPSASSRCASGRIVATGNTVLTIAYHLLADPDARFHDLGADHYDSRINKERRARNLAAQLQAATGQTIRIRNGKAVIIDPEAASPHPTRSPPADGHWPGFATACLVTVRFSGPGQNHCGSSTPAVGRLL